MSAAAETVFVKGVVTTLRPSRAVALGWTFVVVLTVAYTLSFAWLSAFSLQDYPNHLARALIMSDLMFHAGEHFGDLYQFHFAAVPYVLGDLLLAGAVDLLGVRGATTLWIALVMLSLPLALLCYLRTTEIAPRAQILILILSLYLSTDGFLFMGFLTFRLAIAMTVLGLAAVQRLRLEWSARLFAMYCALVVLGYLMHLSTLIFLVAAISASGVLRLGMRRSSIRKECYFLVPLGVVALWHFGVRDHAHAVGDLTESTYEWGSWYLKIVHLQWEFMRYYAAHIDGRIDKLLLLMFALSVLWPLRGQLSRTALLQPAVLEMLLLAAVFFGMYIVMPSSYGYASYLDLRPLALVPIFLVLACACLPANESPAYNARAGVALALAAFMATVNLAHLTLHFVKDNAWMARYRVIVAALPNGARVLPMFPGTDELRLFMHAASFAVIDRSAMIPYLFSDNLNNPQSYFRYTRMPYAPEPSWYYWGARSDVDWRAVACSYDYLLLTKPFDLRRIRVPTTPVVENASAALLAVTKSVCVPT